MFQMNVGQRGKQLPSAALVTNFPGGDGKGYMEQSQVETFLHEFGHLIHWLTMGHQRWVRNTDPEWDFIEAPSQMLENWLFDVDTVQRFATNDAGEPIPAELIAKTRAAEDFGQGMFVFSQMSLADLSLSLHDRDPESFAMQSLVDGINDRYRLFGKVDGVHHYTAFGHLANAPYAASYYLYMWSLVIADDMFSRFDRGGLRNREISFDYRDEVLAPGGSRPTSVSIEAFLGRPYGFESFERRLGGPDR
jgi:thimet oligopeptidase